MSIATHITNISILLLLGRLSVWAQNEEVDSDTIAGWVADEQTKQPIEFATVSLWKASDSTLVNSTSTNDEGYFNVSYSSDQYYLRIQHVSYNTKTLSIESDKKVTGIHSLGHLYLSASTRNLSEVEIEGKRSRLEIDKGKKVFWIGEDLTSTSRSASDLLNNIPSLTVDIEGNVEMRGAFAAIQVNGRVYSAGSGKLERLSAHLIERVELITNPSAREQASGQAGIVNIVLKKNPNEGVSAAINLLGGYPISTSASATIDYRRDPFYAQGSYGYRNMQEQGWNVQKTQSLTDDTKYQNQSNENTETDLAHVGELELEYAINEKSLLNVFSSFQYGSEINQITGDRTEANQPASPQRYIRQELEDEREYSYEGELSYETKFANEGELAVSLGWEQENKNEIEEVSETSQEVTNGYERQSSLLKRKETELSAEVEYIRPLSEDASVNAGYEVESESRREDGEIMVINYGSDTVSRALSNDVTFRQTVHSAFAEYEREVGAFYYRMGGRSELTQMKIYQNTDENSEYREYIDFFPNLLLQYEVNDNQTLKVGYNRRIDRPRLSMLNPFITNLDPQRVRQGNPNLRPEYSHSVELDHVLERENTTINTVIYGRRQSNIAQYAISLRDSIAIYTPQNVSKGYTYGAEIISSSEFFPWLSSDVSVGAFRQVVYGDSQDIPDNRYATFFAKVRNTIDVGNINFQSTFNFQGGGRRTYQLRNLPIYYVDLGVSRSILNERGKVTCSVIDLFNTNVERIRITDERFLITRESQRRRRQFFISISYLINQKDKKGKRLKDDYQESTSGSEF